MNKRLGIVLLALTFAGCASTQTVPVSKETMMDMSGKSLAVAKRDKPDFFAVTAGKMMFGLIGAGAMAGAGNKIVQDNGIEDPADSIAKTLSDELAQRHGVVVSPDSQIAGAEDNVAALSRLYNGHDYLLDVKTFDWGFQYFPVDWNSYRVYYKANLRLIDTRQRKSVAEAFCAYEPEKTEDAPSKEELIENNAELLKAGLRAATEFCIEEFRAKTLKVGFKGSEYLKPSTAGTTNSNLMVSSTPTP